MRSLLALTGTLYWYALLVRLLARDTRIKNKRRRVSLAEILLRRGIRSMRLNGRAFPFPCKGHAHRKKQKAQPKAVNSLHGMINIFYGFLLWQ